MTLVGTPDGFQHGVTRCPASLFHYTSVESLAHILKSRKIRLGRLDRVDDAEEGLSSDLGDFGKHIFITCWTSDSEESPLGWRRYLASPNSVRIEFRLPIFERNRLKHPLLRSVFESCADSCFAPEEFLLGEDYCLMPEGSNNFLPVCYADEEALLKPSIHEQFGGCFEYSRIDRLGLVKRKDWSDQCEWRFRVFLAAGPLDLRDGSDEQIVSESFNAIVSPMSSKEVPVDYIDVPISEKAWDSMKIRMSPSMDSSHQIFCEALVDKYNPKATLEESQLVGRIRRRID